MTKGALREVIQLVENLTLAKVRGQQLEAENQQLREQLTTISNAKMTEITPPTQI